MSQVKLTADSGGGTTSLKAPSSTTSNADVVLKLPVADGSANQVLKTDGSGQLSFTSNAGTTINNNADNRVLTGTGTANTIQGESGLIFDGQELQITNAQPKLKLIDTGVSNVEARVDGDGGDLLIAADHNNAVADSLIKFEIDQSEKLRITSSGNVLVGTTSTAPILKFGNSAVGFAVKGGQPTLAVEASANSDYVAYLGQAGTNSYLGALGGGDLIFQLGTAGTERMRIDSSGDLMLSTGTLIIKNAASDSSGLKISQESSDESRIFNHFSGPLTFGTGNTERMRIDSSGRLLVGRTSSITIASDPSDHNFEQLTNNGMVIACNCDQANQRGIGIFYTAGKNASDFFRCHVDTTPKVIITGSGNVQNANNSYGSISDISLKENIVDAKSQWNDIKNIKVRNYNFKQSTGQSTHTQIGVIAQELETVSPKLIETSEEDELKTVQYSVLYMKAVKALQEAQTRIETLETKVAALEAA